MNTLFKEFLSIAKHLNNEFGISPLLYGSLGLGMITNIDFKSKDIDILIPHNYLNEDWNKLKQAIENLGYYLEDVNEHEFCNGKHKIGFSYIEDLTEFAQINIDEIEEKRQENITYKVLNLEQYDRVYQRSAQDGYRVHYRNKKDGEKLKIIKQLRESRS
ncbi:MULTISPECIES: nucleotidyltransferase family protein [Gracilibacillus]|uniref:hypothetical protein n=1 Tax=Gracilibacillus TaxID=74385 RepID=UPI0008240470|nr:MULTISPECIES: hypothetical protein [Gracilibacillus]